MSATFTNILIALIVALTIYQIILFILKRLHRHQTFKRMNIPGPRPNFFHGNLYETRRQAYVKFAHKMHDRYGKNVGMYLGGDPYLMTKDLDLIQQVFVAKSRIFYDRMDFYLNVDPVPDNLICQRGDRWRYMRKLLTPAFSNNKIRSSYFYRDAEQTVEKFMRQLNANSINDSRQVTLVDDLYDRMAAIALDVIVKTAFHMDNMISFEGPLRQAKQESFSLFGGLLEVKREKRLEQKKGEFLEQEPQNRRESFLNTVKLACRLGFNPLVELIFCFPFLDKPLTFLCNQLYFGSIIKLLFDRLEYLVRRYPNKPANNDANCASNIQSNDTNNCSGQIEADSRAPGMQSVAGGLANGNRDCHVHRRRIVDSLIEVLKERRITRSEFTGNAFVIVFAGFETTANALTFTLWLLAKHPAIQEKLRQELRDKINSKATIANGNSKGKFELSDLVLLESATGCEYLEMVINESLRLYPPVPGLSCRQASQECKLSNGLTIEKGVNVIPSVFSIHRDKSIWGEQANEFKPERFETFSMNQLNSAMFMPFGLGPRNCIGKAAAMHELKIVIGRLVMEYSIEPAKGRTPEKLKLCSPINITITNAERIPMNFVKLSD